MNCFENSLCTLEVKVNCKTVVKDRIVEDGNISTVGAVSTSLNLGLYLCEKWAGP
jgi:cyclohexyl-isocyanide hydratase